MIEDEITQDFLLAQVTCMNIEEAIGRIERLHARAEDPPTAT